MRLSQLFGKTQREIPADADTASHQLLLKAGLIHQTTAGVYTYLPLAWRALKKIENIIREEMDAAGGQELMMPVLQPVELWRETGRDEAFGKGLFTLQDRRERILALGPTHEEVITTLVSHNVQSYRDLPLLLYQIQTKFRDEPRPRAGLIRAREFIMKDLYSFNADEASLEESYQKMLKAYGNLYRRCGLPYIVVEADSGAIGGKDSHEFMVIAETGEDEIMHCPQCGYSANTEKAVSAVAGLPEETPLPVEEVATPGMASIEEVSDFLKVPRSRTLKAVFYVTDGEFVFVVIRGDIEVNEVKLRNRLKCSELRLATEAEVKTAGIVAGSASPVGVKGIKIIADNSVNTGTNFVAGANQPDTHLKNVSYPRDFQVDSLADIARARAGDRCPTCGNELISMRGIEVGHVFKLGTVFSEKLGAYYIDAEGNSHPIIMGCYGIGVGRLLQAAIEQNHDDKGIIWPLPIAPYQVYLCPLHRENSGVETIAEKLHTELEAKGLEVLFDDRRQSPGVQFNDADLLGIPLRVTISARTLEKKSLELKWRSEAETSLIPLEGAATAIAEAFKEGLAQLR
jgi:prolyl-tRNA synthetase